MVFLSTLFMQCETTSEELVVPKANIKTLSSEETLSFIKDQKIENFNMRNSEEPFVEVFSDHISQEAIINSEEYLTVLPAVTKDKTTYSRVLLLNVNGSTEAVVYSMYSYNNFTSVEFTGRIFISDMQGELISAFEMEDGYYVSQYQINATDSAARSLASRDDCDCLEGWECSWCQLDEVVITTKKKTIKLGDLYTSVVPNEEDFNESLDAVEQVGGGGGVLNTNTCDAGQVKNNDGACVDSDTGCPSGFGKNEQEQCVKLNIDNAGPDCESFDFTEVGSTNWQCAAVSGVSETFSVFDWSELVYNYVTGIFTQPLYFQMPGTYRPGSAAQKSAEALREAFIRFDVYYDLHYNDGYAALENKLREFIIEEMQEYGGTMTLTPPLGYIGTVRPYRTTIWGTGNCE